MVRINIINPAFLMDQHLIAEWNEILMLFGSAVTFDKTKVKEIYMLGKGHINFFKNKLVYLKKRHEIIGQEMRRRGYNTNASVPSLSFYKPEQLQDWEPNEEVDFPIIIQRLIEKIKMKEDYSYYTHYGNRYSNEELINIINRSKSPLTQFG